MFVKCLSSYQSMSHGIISSKSIEFPSKSGSQCLWNCLCSPCLSLTWLSCSCQVNFCACSQVTHTFQPLWLCSRHYSYSMFSPRTAFGIGISFPPISSFSLKSIHLVWVLTSSKEPMPLSSSNVEDCFSNNCNWPSDPISFLAKVISHFETGTCECLSSKMKSDIISNISEPMP